ncbi:hypothetical protein, partial [Streptomyces sp. NPDC007355]|uniref:hypothetical protein n=1 Tax=Streptomyces sp. NPDC007355 TaxID=3364778 RepID=UPI0036915E1B
TGVVAADAGRSGHAALSVVPAYVLHHDAEFRAVLAEHCARAMTIEYENNHYLATTKPQVTTNI